MGKSSFLLQKSITSIKRGRREKDLCIFLIFSLFYPFDNLFSSQPKQQKKDDGEQENKKNRAEKQEEKEEEKEKVPFNSVDYPKLLSKVKERQTFGMI